ncbi:hypothetical protein OBCHQ24_02970 [Oceanobacillus iheyensis]|nr:hypothetical protein OBCHQ24_02970 [Oceanobacillus iheyensis]
MLLKFAFQDLLKIVNKRIHLILNSHFKAEKPKVRRQNDVQFQSMLSNYRRQRRRGKSYFAYRGYMQSVLK